MWAVFGLPTNARTNRHQNTTLHPASSEQLIMNTWLAQGTVIKIKP